MMYSTSLFRVLICVYINITTISFQTWMLFKQFLPIFLNRQELFNINLQLPGKKAKDYEIRRAHREKNIENVGKEKDCYKEIL